MSDEQRLKPGVAREYRNDDIVVYWEPKLCIHTGNCIGSLPQVFDPDARPWVKISAGEADKIAEAVMLCPTGALRFERLDGGPQESPPEETTISERTNGPLFVRGRIRIMGPGGEVIREATRAALCRCGHSQNKPFCDLSHRKVGFRTSEGNTSEEH